MTFIATFKQQNCRFWDLNIDVLSAVLDKTGTLTQNRMTVAHMWFDNQERFYLMLYLTFPI